MTQTTHTLTSKDGTALHATWWQPEAPKAVVAHVHGLGEHSARHDHVARKLVNSGYAVARFDLRGHGRSAGARGHTPMAGALDDVDILLADAAQRAPGLPVFLYGHSLGGLIVLVEALKRRPKVVGVVATSPGLRSPVLDQRLKMTAAKLLGRVLPSVALPSGLDDAGLSRDRAVIEAYRADPLVHDKASLALAKDGSEYAQYALTRAGDFAYPLLLVHGSDDPITYARGSEEFAAQVKGDVTLKIYPGLLHETHNEPEQAEVLADVVAWLDAHLG